MTLKERVRTPYRKLKRIAAPFLKVRIVVSNPRNNRQTTFEEECWVDTGFSGGVHVPQYRMSEVQGIGIEPSLIKVRLSGGIPGTGFACVGSIRRIQGFNIPPPGIETELLIRGAEPGYLGLGVLRNWVAIFDGLQQILSIHEQESKL